MIAFKCTKNLQEIIGGHTVKQGKVFKKNRTKLNGNSMPCSSTRPSLCCTQVLNTQTFTSQQTKRTFNIFHKLTCKSQYVIYLMECILWKTQYVGKSENPFNLKINNHRKDFNNPKAIPPCNHFKIHGHNVLNHAKLTLIEQLTENEKLDLKIFKTNINKVRNIENEINVKQPQKKKETMNEN